MEIPQKKTFFREWGALITFAIFAVLALGSFRLWTEHKANAPVLDGYQMYVDELAANSARAAAFLNAYYSKFNRRTVASKDFQLVCATVTAFADHDGFDAESVSVEMAKFCRIFIREEIKNALR